MSFLFTTLIVSTLILQIYAQPSCSYTFDGTMYQALGVCAELAVSKGETILHYKYECTLDKSAVERPIYTTPDCSGSPKMTLSLDGSEYQDFNCSLPICTDNIGIVRYHYSCPAYTNGYDDRIYIANYCSTDRLICCDAINFYEYRFKTDGQCTANEFDSTVVSATPFSKCGAGVYEAISCNQTNQCIFQAPPPTPSPTFAPVIYNSPRPVINYANIFGFGVPLNYCTSPNSAGSGETYDSLVNVPNCDGIDNIQFGRFFTLGTNCAASYLMQWGVDSINTVATEGLCNSSLSVNNDSYGYAMMDITMESECLAGNYDASQRWPALVNYCFYNGEYFRKIYCNDSLAVAVFYTDSACNDFHAIEFMIGVNESFGCSGATTNYYVYTGVCTSDQIIPAQVLAFVEFENGNINNPCDYMIADGIPWAADMDNGNGGTFCVNWVYPDAESSDNSFKLSCKTYQDTPGNTKTDIFSLNYNALNCNNFRDSSIVSTDNFIDYRPKCGYGSCDNVGYMNVKKLYDEYWLETHILTNVCVYNYMVKKRIQYRCDRDAAIIEYFDSFDCSGNPVQISNEWCLNGVLNGTQFMGCFNYHNNNQIIQSNIGCPQQTSSPSSSPTDPTTSQPTTLEPTTSNPTTVSPTPTVSTECEKDVNYWIDGNPCTLNGDPHFRMFNGDRHSFMGIGSVSNQYYYVTRCYGVSIHDMPFSILATHRKCGGSVTCLDYITIELWDENNKYHLIWLNARTQQYKYAVNVEYSKTVTLFGQTAQNANDIQQGSQYQISSRFTIKRPGSNGYFILTVFGNKYSVKIYVRRNALVIKPVLGFECLACGLCGDFKLPGLYRSRGYSLLPNCNSKKYSKIKPGYRSNHKTAYSQNGLSWKRYDVCDRSADSGQSNVRRVLAANSIEIEELDPLPTDFVFIDDCPENSDIENIAKTECENKRNEYADICSQLSDQCDELQNNCNYDACATAQGNISAVKPAVDQMFGELLDIYRSDEINITQLFDDTKIFARPDSGVPEIYEPIYTTTIEVETDKGVTYQMNIIVITVAVISGLYVLLN